MRVPAGDAPAALGALPLIGSGIAAHPPYTGPEDGTAGSRQSTPYDSLGSDMDRMTRDGLRDGLSSVGSEVG